LLPFAARLVSPIYNAYLFDSYFVFIGGRKRDEATLTLNRDLMSPQMSVRVAVQSSPAFVRLAALVALIVASLGALLSGAPVAVLAAGASFAALLFLLWPADDLPLLLLPAMYQWSQVAVKPVLTVVYEKPIDRVLDLGFRLQTGTEAAALFGLAGVTCLGIGMFLGSGKRRLHAVQSLRMETQRWSGTVVLRLSLGAIVVGHAAAAFSGLAGPAYQLFLAFSGLLGVGIFGFAYWCFINSTGYRYLMMIMVFEVVVGLTGFFADFRIPILVFAIAALAARPSFRVSSLAIISFVAVLILSLATFWSEIKNDYRRFANGGTGAQATVQPWDARLSYIATAASEFDRRQFADGFNRLLARHSYIDFLGATMNYVPDFVPHEDGHLIGAAVENMLMPRVLFPDKPPLPSDTAVTVQYTGLDLGNSDQTSISIGYLGELYIDFGYIGALCAMIVLGAGVGFAYRKLRDFPRLPRLVNYSICVMLPLSVLDFGTALVKTINGAVLVFGAALVVQRIIAPRVLPLFLPRSPPRTAPARRV